MKVMWAHDSMFHDILHMKSDMEMAKQIVIINFQQYVSAWHD